MVVEDDEFQRLVIIGYLVLCEFKAVGVANGRLALEELRKPKNDFDLILLDLTMPEMNGFELLSLIQEDQGLKRIPVVVMSSTESKKIISHCLCKFLL